MKKAHTCEERARAITRVLFFVLGVAKNPSHIPIQTFLPFHPIFPSFITLTSVMESKNQEYAIPETHVTSKIYIVRNKKIMLDRDLAELYEVETRVLNQAVSRNKERFPEEFMFQLTPEEFEILKSQIVTSS